MISRRRRRTKVRLSSSRQSSSVTRLTASRHRRRSRSFCHQPRQSSPSFPRPNCPRQRFFCRRQFTCRFRCGSVRHVTCSRPNNVIFANLHNRVVTNRAANSFMVTDHEGRTRTLSGPQASRDRNWQLGRPGAQRRQQPTFDGNVGPALPPSVAELAGRRDGAVNRLRRERPQRDDRPSVPLPGSTVPGPSEAPGRSAAAPRQPSFLG